MIRSFAGYGRSAQNRGTPNFILAESDASVWMPVLKANEANIAPHLDAVLRIAREMLRGDDGPFARAQQFVR